MNLGIAGGLDMLVQSPRCGASPAAPLPASFALLRRFRVRPPHPVPSSGPMGVWECFEHPKKTREVNVCLMIIFAFL